MISDSGKAVRSGPRRSGLLGPWSALAIGFGAALVGGLLIEVGKLSGLSSGPVLRDVAASYDLPVVAGAVTMLCVSLLAVTGAIAAFTAGLLTGKRALPVLVAVLSLMLCIDDHYMLHEKVLPDTIGLPEIAPMAVYAVGVLVVTILAYGELGLGGMAGLWPAVGFLAFSVVADLEIFTDSSYASEDLTKLAGLAAWAAFWWTYCARRLRAERDAPSTAAPDRARVRTDYD